MATKTVREVLEAAREAQITLWAANGKIKYKTESGPIPESLRKDIEAIRSAVYQALSIRRTPGSSRQGGAGTATEAELADGIGAIEVRRGRRGGRERVVAEIPATTKAKETEKES